MGYTVDTKGGAYSGGWCGPITRLPFQSRRSHRVDAPSKQFLQMMPMPRERKNTNRAVELHQNVSISLSGQVSLSLVQTRKAQWS